MMSTLNRQECHSARSGPRAQRRATMLALAIAAGGLSSDLMTPAYAQTEASVPPGYRTLPFQLPADTEKMLIVDADGDGLSDLMTIAGASINLYFQRPAAQGFNFEHPDTRLDLPWSSVGWELTSSSAGEGAAVVALVDGTRVLQWEVHNRAFGEAEELLADIVGFAGSGINRLNFSQDINGDGIDDLIIPGAGTLQLFIRNSGGYQPAINVLSDMRIRSNLFVRQAIERDVGQTLRIPLVELRDINGDSLPDLISDTDERLDVFLSNTSGDYFTAEPTFSIDRLEIRQRLGEFDVDQLDFSNLTGILSLTHEEVLEDVDNDGIADLILREGGKVSLFGGNTAGVDFSEPRQVLRSGGNVLTTFLYDEDGDGLKDLWLWRIEPISVGDIFLWLAISGSINVEAFVYPNEGSSFARRPTRQLTVALRFPSVIRLLGAVTDIREQASSVRETRTIPTTMANITNVASSRDLLVLLEQQVEIFLNSVENEPAEPADPFLASLDYSRQRNDYVIDVQKLIEEFQIEQNAELTAVAGRSPDHVVALPQAMRNGDLMTGDLNADALDDIFVFLERGDEHISGLLLLSTP